MGRWKAWTMHQSLLFTWRTSLSLSQWAASTTTQTRPSPSCQISQRTTVFNKRKRTIPIQTPISKWTTWSPRIAKQRRQRSREVAGRARTVRHSSSHTYRGSRSSWRKTWYLHKTTPEVKCQQAALLCAIKSTEVPKDPHSLRIWATLRPWTHQWKTLRRSIGNLNLCSTSRRWDIWTNRLAQLPYQTALWSKNLSSAKRSS